MENTNETKNALSGFAAHLAEEGLLDREKALEALEKSQQASLSYVEYITQQQLLDDYPLAKATSEYYGFPLCDPTAFDIENIPQEFINSSLVKNRQGLPIFKKNDFIYLAVTDPTLESVHEMRFLTGLDVRFFIAEHKKLTSVIDDLVGSRILDEMSSMEDEVIDNSVTVDVGEDDPSGDMIGYDVESAPVVNYVNKVLVDAIEKGASDIHFEHYENSYRIRLRIHGMLTPINSPPPKLANYLLARIKVISNLDITEHRLPQDGRFKLILSRKRSVDFRVSVCPTVFGEKVVLRVLDPSNITQGISELGMGENEEAQLVDALSRSQGMILVTGPTGSGKTVTLYSSLIHLNSPEKNISTVEDPVEIPVQGINQVHVNAKVGLTFAAALRSFLRQDPDIVMVGEIRDLETAEIATKAAQTGHLVLSTLHTNSAPETVTRLMNMGIPTYNLATSLTLVIAQRLVRVLCDRCKVEQSYPKETLLKEGFAEADVDNLKLFKAGSCDHCTGGYKGRVAIFEVMPISHNLSELIIQNANTIQIAEQASKEGVVSLRQAGLIKVKAGITSIEELNRVFK